jgi:hypothetical protein
MLALASAADSLGVWIRKATTAVPAALDKVSAFKGCDSEDAEALDLDNRSQSRSRSFLQRPFAPSVLNGRGSLLLALQLTTCRSNCTRSPSRDQPAQSAVFPASKLRAE